MTAIMDITSHGRANINIYRNNLGNQTNIPRYYEYLYQVLTVIPKHLISTLSLTVAIQATH